MKKLTLLSLLLLLGQWSIAQLSHLKQVKLVDEVLVACDSLEDIKPLDSLVSTNNIDEEKLYIKLMKFKLKNQPLYSDIYTYDDCGAELNYEKVILFFEESRRVIDTIPCHLQANLNLIRYQTFKIIANTSTDFRSQKIDAFLEKEQEKLKYRWGINGDERTGLGTGLGYIVGKQSWIGLDVSPLTFYTAPYTYTDTCGIDLFIEKSEYFSTTSLSLLTTSFYYGLKSNDYDIALSLIEFNSPFVLAPAKFGITMDESFKTKNWFYRPTVGISFGPVAISYAYNVPIAKQTDTKTEKHLLNIRFIYPLIRYKKLNSSLF